MKFLENIPKSKFFSMNFSKKSQNLTEPSIGFIEGVPYLNSMYNYSQALVLTTQPENYPNILNNYIKSCPEQIFLSQAVTFDIMSDGYYFLPVQKTDSEKKIKRAENWCMSNNFDNGVEDGLFDYFNLGNVAWWYKIDSNSSKTNISKMIDKYNFFVSEDKQIKIKEVMIDEEIEIKLKEFEEFKIQCKQFKDEDYNRLLKFRHVAWTSVSILSSAFEVLGFMQSGSTGGPIVDYNTGKPLEGRENYGGMVRRIWPPSQIIHGKYMGWDGREYGYSPVIASMPVISQIIQLRAYAGRYFEDAGAFDKMFIFEGANPNDSSVLKFNQMLQTVKKASKKRGHYVGTSPGKLNVIELNKWDKDMEFLNLYVSCVATLASNFQMPLGRAQAILGMVTKAPPSDLADPAYWRFIKSQQNKLENLFNTQIFIPYFGVKIKFNNSYIQDEIRKAQLDTQNVAAVMGMEKIFRESGKQLTIEKKKELFMIKDDELEDFDIKKFQAFQEQIAPPNFTLPGNQDKTNQSYRDQRKNEQNKRQESLQQKNEGM